MRITLRKFPIYTEENGEDVETLYDIECDLTPEEKETPRTFDDGGSPGAPAECEILTIKLNGKEVPSELWEKIGLDERHRDEIREEAFQKAEPDTDPPDSWEPKNVYQQDDPHDD